MLDCLQMSRHHFILLGTASRQRLKWSKSEHQIAHNFQCQSSHLPFRQTMKLVVSSPSVLLLTWYLTFLGVGRLQICWSFKANRQILSVRVGGSVLGDLRILLSFFLLVVWLVKLSKKYR
ncbi:hypothetical protein CROQUDRAFT_629548 [Cronartium quercuum f. sp. fusiforme G11]|uniref:Uncharacterized protein n=1 Tax=Cronartium quercuum f. sp. fusiforme G11 TaxID=708437 RepID=A0A9P6TFQ1_9BASI|nr:hypothetical protein CROQUDRAFT_629548 [Cronartium quercuum f. sp. fusiforme G11]